MTSAWLWFLRFLFLDSVALAVIPYGSVSPGWLGASNIFSALVFILSLTRPMPVGRKRAVFLVSAWVVAALTLWVLLQSWQFVGNSLAHPIWKIAEDLIGGSGGAVSVDPATTRAALPNLITPFLAFLTIPLLYRDDRSLMLLWWALALFGAAIAAFAIVQTTLFPDRLLWGERTVPMAGVTATFVNRNTAVTFLGLAALLPIGLGVRQIGRMRRDGGFEALREGKATPGAFRLMLLFVMMMTDLTAMFMTQSRGGVFATFLGVSVTVVLLAMQSLRGQGPSLARLLVPVLVIAVTLAGFVTYAGQAIRRAEMLGVDHGRLCTYQGTLNAIADFPLFGTGFGTFDQVFPHYRITECAGIDNVWYKAHNVYLEGYLGLGLPFAIATAIGIVALVAVAIEGMRTRRRFHFSGAVLFGALVLVLMHSAVDFSMQIHGVAIWVAAIFGLTTALSLGRPRSRSWS